MRIKRILSKLKLSISNDSGVVEYFRKKGVKIGDNCSIEKNVLFGAEPYLITIGNEVRITQGVKFVTHDGSMWVLRNLKLLENADKFGKIIIGNNVNIGWETIIMPGVTIGNNVIIGAGSIVTKDLGSNGVYAGVPAKKICDIKDYYNKNKDIVDYTKNMNAVVKRDYLEKKYGMGKYEG